ncbi:MAG: HEPN domain-containing protein [Nitrospirae bacterium]|nr:HEPN domain-containing protein [Nitrospirota bacterium]
MIEVRLKYAQIYLEDAKLLYENKKYNSAISRLYYSSYQAMWAAIGEPDEGKVWKHLAIIKPFVHGFWFNPAHPQQTTGLLEHFRLPLRQLYTYRIKADYEVLEINQNIVENIVKTVDDLINTVLLKGRYGS